MRILPWVLILVLARGASLVAMELQDTAASAAALEQQAAAAERSGDLQRALDLYVRARQARWDASVRWFSDGIQTLDHLIMRVAGRLARLPAPPGEAAALVDQSLQRLKNADAIGDFDEAADQMMRAVAIAPWLPQLRYNEALLWEAVGDIESVRNERPVASYAWAIYGLELYLEANPPDASQARARIAAVRDKQFAASAKDCLINADPRTWPSSPTATNLSARSACYSAGDEYRKRGNLEKALEFYQRGCAVETIRSCGIADEVLQQMRKR